MVQSEAMSKAVWQMLLVVVIAVSGLVLAGLAGGLTTLLR